MSDRQTKAVAEAGGKAFFEHTISDIEDCLKVASARVEGERFTPFGLLSSCERKNETEALYRLASVIQAARFDGWKARGEHDAQYLLGLVEALRVFSDPQSWKTDGHGDLYWDSRPHPYYVARKALAQLPEDYQ